MGVVSQGCEHEWGTAVLVLGVNQSSLGEEGPDNVVVTIGSGQVKGRLRLKSNGVHVLNKAPVLIIVLT